MKVEDWAKERGLARYFGSSIKASRDVDWDDAEAKEAFLTELIADGERVLAMARQARCSLEEALGAGLEDDEGVTVEQVIGDTAYGSTQVRKELEGREVIAPTVKGGRGAAIRKDEFEIEVKRFVFDTDVCRACPRHAECVTGKLRRG